VTWLCNCGILNSGLNKQCAAIKSQGVTKHYQISANTPDFLMAVVAGKELNLMTPQEELFAKFYGSEKVLVKDMDIAQLREHIEELSQIVYEAKARLVAAGDEDKERRAKTKNKDWLVTADTSIAATSDAINVVKIRTSRMSKMDKIRASLLTVGIDEETVNEMVRNMERKATEKDLKTITFNKPSTEVSAIQVKATKPIAESNGEPFNPLSLGFGEK